MVCHSLMPNVQDIDFKILATDIDRNVLETAQRGRYTIENEELRESPYLSKYLIPQSDEPGTYEVDPDVANLVHFAELNLQNNWPMSGLFDLIFCRNVVIYFNAETQNTLWQRFADKLKPGGHLVIGHSEKVAGPAIKRLISDGVTCYRLKDA